MIRDFVEALVPTACGYSLSDTSAPHNSFAPAKVLICNESTFALSRRWGGTRFGNGLFGARFSRFEFEADFVAVEL